MAVYARMRVAVAVAVCGSVEVCDAEPLMCVCFVPAGWVVCRSAISTPSGNRALTRLRSVCAMRLTACAATKR